MLADHLLADDARLFLVLAVVLDALQVVLIGDTLDDLERLGIRRELDFLRYLLTRPLQDIARADQEAFHQKAKIDIGLQAALHLADFG